MRKIVRERIQCCSHFSFSIILSCKVFPQVDPECVYELLCYLCMLQFLPVLLLFSHSSNIRGFADVNVSLRYFFKFSFICPRPRYFPQHWITCSSVVSEFFVFEQFRVISILWLCSCRIWCHVVLYILAIWRNLSTTLHGVMSQKTTVILVTTSRMSDLIFHPDACACHGIGVSTFWHDRWQQIKWVPDVGNCEAVLTFTNGHVVHITVSIWLCHG